MTARNDITGDAIHTKSNSEAYRSGWDAIFGVKVKPLDQLTPEERMVFVHRWWIYCEQKCKELDTIPQFEEWYLTKSMEPDPEIVKAKNSYNPDDYAY